MSRKQIIGAIIALIFLTAISFWPSLFNDFLHWDDHVLVVGNPLITRGVPLKEIFTTMVTSNYIPLTILSFNFEYIFFKLNPFYYHLDNLILHIVTTLLILWLCLRLGFPSRASVFTAALFAIHPMHVESVALISERKDVLYAALYLLAIHQYLSYKFTSKISSYVFSVIFCALSMLAKPQALTLPFILFLIDWLQDRKFSWRSTINKIPFFVIIIPLAAVTYFSHKPVPFDAGGGALIWVWSFAFYLGKFFIPITFLPIYLIPGPISFLNGEYLIAFGVFVVFISSLIFFRKNYLWLFACGFYIFSIFFLLRFNNEGDTPVVVDHYMYLASFGFCLFIGAGLDRIIKNAGKSAAIILGLVIILYAMLATKTFAQCRVWENDLSFINAVAQKYPQYHRIYEKFGHYYAQEKRYDLAIENFKKSFTQKIDHDFWVYNNIGMAYLGLGKTDEAFKNYELSLKLNSNCPETYMNRATLYDSIGKYDLAFDDYAKAIDINPHFAQAYHNRAIIYFRRQQLSLALQDLTKAINVIPDFWTAFYLRGQIHFALGQAAQAVDDFDSVLKLNPQRADARAKKDAIRLGANPTHFTLDIPSDTYEQGPWRSDSYQNYMPAKDYFYQLPFMTKK